MPIVFESIAHAAECLAQNEIIAEGQRSFDQLQASAAAAEADAGREKWSGEQQAANVTAIRARIATVRGAVKRLSEIAPGDPAIKSGRQLLQALRALRTELAADPEE